MSFQAGRLRHRITIRRLGDVSNGKGAWVRGWTTVVENLPAEVIGQNGREAVIANTLQGTSTFRIIIRHREGLRANDQVLYGGMELNIVAPPIDPDGRREITQIFADTSSPQNAGV